MVTRMARRYSRIAGVLAACCLAPLPSASAESLQAFSAEYRIISKGMGIEIGRIERRLEKTGEYYTYHSSSQATGLADLVTRDRRSEQSRLHHTGEGLRALSYTYRRDSRKKQQSREAKFDWDNARLILSSAGTRRELELSAGTIDRLGSELILMQNLRRGDIEGVYRITNGNTVHDYRIEVLQRNAAVQTPLGKLSGVQLRRRRATGDAERETLLWCIPELGYLPVRIENNVDAFIAELIYYRDEERELSATGTATGATPLSPPL